MNQKLKRYDPEMIDVFGVDDVDMIESTNGDYVEFNDYQKLKAQLEKAERVIDFYSDSENWGHISYERADYVVILDDSGTGDFQLNHMTNDDRVGGRRAREYFKEKEQV